MSVDMFGRYQSQTTRQLAQIQSSKYPDTNKDMEANLRRLNDWVDYIAGYLQVMQKGVDQANEDSIARVKSMAADLVVLLGGGELLYGIDLGDLQYFLPALGAIFGFDSDKPFPISLFEMAEHFFLGYVVPLDSFTAEIEDIILGWLNAVGLSQDNIDAIRALLDAVSSVTTDSLTLFENLWNLLDIFGINTDGLGPFADLWHAVTQLLGAFNLQTIGNIVDPVFTTLAPWIREIAQAVDQLDNIIKSFSGGLTDLQGILNFASIFNNLNFLDTGGGTFDPITAVAQMITNVFNPAGGLATWAGALIPGLDASKIVSGLFSMGMINGLMDVFSGLDLSDPGAVINAIAQLVAGPLINAITGSSWTGHDISTLPGTLTAWVQKLDSVYELANGAWSFASQAFTAITQIIQQLESAPIFTAWGDLLNSLQFWTFGWFTNTYTTQQQTTTNSTDIGLIYAHLNPVTASIYYNPQAAVPLTASYVGPDGVNSGHPAFTTLSGVTQMTKGDGYFGGDTDFAPRGTWFTGNPMNAVTDHGLITNSWHVEVPIVQIGYGTAGFWVNGTVSGNTLGQHLFCEIQQQSFGDAIALATYTAFNNTRTERFRVATNNGMNWLKPGDVVAVENNGAGKYTVFINGVAVKPDSASDYGWQDTGNYLTQGVGHRELGLFEFNNGPKLGPIRAFDIAATAAAGVPIVAPPAVMTLGTVAPRVDGRIIAPATAKITAVAPTPTIAGSTVTPPVTNAPIPMGFSELQQQLASTAAELANMQQLYADVTTIRPKYWRLMAAWNYIAKAQDPGTPTFDSVNNVPTTSNRDWTTIDKCINEILLTGAQPVMMVGQGHPNWSTAATYGDFAAEVATRYKPGGVGIRTDGKFAANAGKGVSIYECWNEQNSSSFWTRTVNPKEYVDYLKQFYPRVKGVPGLGGSSSIVVYGGLQPILRNQYASLWTWAGLPEIDFVTQCWDYEPNLANYFDVMAEHVYPQVDTATYPAGGATDMGPVPTLNIDNMKQLQAIRDLMVAKGAGSKDIWITEAGYSNNTLTEAQSNTYIQQLYALFQGLGYVKAVMWYNIRNTGTDPNDFNSNFGFEDTAFRKKPAWNWFATYSAITPAPAMLNVASPKPIIIDIIKPPAASEILAAATPIIVKPIIAPAAAISESVVAPTIKNITIAPPATVAVSAPTPSVVGSISAPAAAESIAAPAPIIIDVVKPPAATVSAAAPNPIIVDVISAPVAAVSLAAPAPTVTLFKAFWIGVAPAPAYGTSYQPICPTRQCTWQSAETGANDYRVALSDPCNITKFTVWLTNAPGASQSWTLKLRKNGADTAVSVTLTGAAVSGSWTGSVALSALDLVGVSVVNSAGSPANTGDIYWTIEYQTTSNYQMLPAANLNYGFNSNTTDYNPPSGGSNIAPTATATDLEELCPTAVTITKIAAYVANGAPGAGNTNTYVVRKNNASDSAFSAVISGASAQSAVSGAGAGLSLSAGDTFVVKQTKGPNSGWSELRTCLTIVPTNAGEVILPFGNLNQPSTTAVNYETPVGTGNNGWNATESAVQFRANACTIKSLYAKINTAPGTGKSRAFKVRSAGADTTVVATVADTATTANDTTHTASHGDGNFLDVSATPSGTPAATAGVKLGMVLVPT